MWCERPERGVGGNFAVLVRGRNNEKKVAVREWVESEETMVGSWVDVKFEAQKKLCKLKLFHYNYYSTQDSLLSLAMVTASYYIARLSHSFHSTLSTSFLVLLLPTYPDVEREGELSPGKKKLFHEFLIWNWFSCIFEFSFKDGKALIPPATTFFIYFSYWERGKWKRAFSNNRWDADGGWPSELLDKFRSKKLKILLKSRDRIVYNLLVGHPFLAQPTKKT